jgi:signal peptidase I
MAAQPQQAAGAASPTTTAGSLFREVAEVVVLAFILYFGISFAIQAVHVEGLSMFATLDNNDYLIANKLDYRFGSPHRGDIIILRPPTDNSKDFIKRVIGLPGDHLRIVNSHVCINGRLLDEPYLPEEWTIDSTWNGGAERVLGANEYFVMGDNRNRSQDSRIFGPITRDRIDGKAWFRIWPLGSFNIYQKVPALEGPNTCSGSGSLTPAAVA